MAQIGQFAALGIAGSFVFVHLVFPHIIPAMPAAKRDRTQRFSELLDRFLHGGSKPKLAGAVALAAVLIFWAQPRFEIDLKAMNTVSEETHAAEKAFSATWGGIQSKILLMLSADSLAALRHKSDALSARFEADIENGILSPGFLP